MKQGHKHLRQACASALALAMALPGAAVAHSTKIPVGDGKVSNSPRAGYVYSCQQRFNPNAGGAHRTGDWIVGNYWYPDRKPVVDGAVRWNGSGTDVNLTTSVRVLTTNGLPTHTSGVYPVSRSDDAYQYDRNPNRIRATNRRVSIPANPQIAGRASCLPMGAIGYALTGVAIFNALDGPGRDAVAMKSRTPATAIRNGPASTTTTDPATA